MINSLIDSGSPHTARRPAGAFVSVVVDETPPTSGHPLLARFLREEAGLYAITREWRYDAAGRKFVRLHELLNLQFSSIGHRLAQLAARVRAVGSRNSGSQGDRVPVSPPALAAGALQAHMIRELLALHESIGKGLRAAEIIPRSTRDFATADLFIALAAAHEQDAFTLRALLEEIQTEAI